MLPTIWIFLLFSLILESLTEIVELAKFRQIWVQQGLVKGRIEKIDGKYSQIFLGIPYAQPPVEKLRFRRPVKKDRWFGEYEAFDYPPACLQFYDYDYLENLPGERNRKNNQKEDCLYLNIFAPYEGLEDPTVHPVVVWIHGGSFLSGAGDTGMDKDTILENFVSRDTLLVTINYRLGLLGFLAKHKSEGKWEGNYGVWDQLMALQWIHKNIKQFGGDPKSVIIMGESAGAACVSVLAMSPLTKDIVHGAIIMSGSSMAGWSLSRESPGNTAWSLQSLWNAIQETNMRLREHGVEQLECGSNVDFLSAEETDKFMECIRTELNITLYGKRQTLAVPLGVPKIVVDGELVPTSGSKLVQEHARIPIMIGVARKEWGLKSSWTYSIDANETLTKSIASVHVANVIKKSFTTLFDEEISEPTLNTISNVTFYQYVTSRYPNTTLEIEQLINALQKIESDLDFVVPCQLEVDGYASAGIPVYVYSWDYVPKSVFIENENQTGWFNFVRGNNYLYLSEPVHGLDHGYIFSKGMTHHIEAVSYEEQDKKMADLFASLITNFAKYKNPTKTPYNNFNWPMYAMDDPQYAQLKLPPNSVSEPLHWPAGMFWNVLATDLTKIEHCQEVEEEYDEASITESERLRFDAYYRAWWALWILVAANALTLWIVIICVIMRKCSRSRPYNNIVFSNNRRQ